MPKVKFPVVDVEFKIPIYGGDVCLLLDEKAFAQALNYCGKNDPQFGLAGRCARLENDDHHVLYLVGWYDGNLHTLAHECGHLAFFVLKRVGIDPTDSQGETYCYLLGYLFDKLSQKPKTKK